MFTFGDWVRVTNENSAFYDDRFQVFASHDDWIEVKEKNGLSNYFFSDELIYSVPK